MIHNIVINLPILAVPQLNYIVGLRLKPITASLVLQCGEFISIVNLYQLCNFVRILKAFV